jgi:glycosyltransferase involved in cell wall biosynthesis
MRVCFFTKISSRELLERVEFYKQDIDILRQLGHEVVIATKWPEIIWDADLYFVWWWQWAFLPLWKNKFSRKPFLITGVFDYRWPSGIDYLHRVAWQKWLMRYSLKKANANVFISNYEFREVTGALEVRNPFYIPMAVDHETYCEGNGNREDFVFTVAWMNKGNSNRKCVPEILRSIPLVQKRHPGMRFVIAGEKGSDFPALEALARDLGVSGSVEFPGVVSREKKIELMQRCRLYLSPSRYEGFGLAILEAMSCGAAVISSPVGSVPEVVGDAGLLVDGTSPKDIAEAVDRYITDGNLREGIGRRARLRAESEFPLSRRKRELEKVISEI